MDTFMMFGTQTRAANTDRGQSRVLAFVQLPPSIRSYPSLPHSYIRIDEPDLPTFHFDPVINPVRVAILQRMRRSFRMGNLSDPNGADDSVQPPETVEPFCGNKDVGKRPERIRRA
ncbi:hypothetical protein C8R43DRAFT_1165527 [Mycena crocata]|nr:hypothetical protein C8R43DRAFT_1165527 [Mycena crocata]